MKEQVWQNAEGDLVVITKRYWESLWRIDYDERSSTFEAYVSLGGYCTDFLCRSGFTLLGEL